MAKMRLLAIWIDQRQSFKIATENCDISYTERVFETEKFHRTIFKSKLCDTRVSD